MCIRDRGSSHHRVGQRRVQRRGLVALLHEHQEFDVPFGALDGRIFQPADGKTVLHGVFRGLQDDLPVGLGLPHDALFAHLFPACFKLGFHKADPGRAGRGDGPGHGKDMFESCLLYTSDSNEK